MTPMSRPRPRVAAAVIALGLLATTGCGIGSDGAEGLPAGGGGAAGAHAGAAAPVLSAARITVTPADATRQVRPEAKVTVAVEDGTLRDVRVVDGRGAEVEGALDDERRTWTASGELELSRRYTASVEAEDAEGVVATTTTTFSTVRPTAELSTSISPLSESTVGVGMPVVVKFSAAVTDRAAVEERLKVTTSQPVVGAWHWFSDTEVHYRPKEYWPAYTDVTVDVDLAGVDAGNGVWGEKSRMIQFSTDAASISVVDVKTLKMTVERDGKIVRTMPVTTGKDGFRTRGGIKVISEKHERKIMDAETIGIAPRDPEYYRLDVPYALRVTWSGEFVHAAEWSEGRQGRENVSHGCVGMSMADGKWFFESSRVGDVIQVVNSDRELEENNGWTDWNVSWEDWQAGSALV